MKKTKKYILIGILGISSFTGLLLFNFIILPNLVSKGNQINYNRELQFEVVNISLSIDYSGEMTNDLFQNINLTNYKTTAYHVLLNCCDIQIRNDPMGIYVKKINGVGEGWIYWINDDPLPNIPSNFFYLLDNDTVYWKYVGR